MLFKNVSLNIYVSMYLITMDSDIITRFKETKSQRKNQNRLRARADGKHSRRGSKNKIDGMPLKMFISLWISSKPRELMDKKNLGYHPNVKETKIITK